MGYKSLQNISLRGAVLLLLMTVQSSCKKYLDKKSRQDLAIPTSLNDLQAVLDNQQANSGSPAYLELVADNYYFTAAAWNGSAVDIRTNYVWDKAAITSDNTSWNYAYQSIYSSNFVLNLLSEIEFNQSERNLFNNVKGTALFYRAFMYHQLAQLFCAPYSNTADSDLGVVLRLTPDVTTAGKRVTVQQTYDQIVGDLKMAAQLLPIQSVTAMRPNKAAAYGELARVYLSMRDYTSAGLYADSCLTLNNALLDYKTISTLPDFTKNPEVLFLSYEGYAPSIMGNPNNCLIDTTLYQLYNANDLRKTLFFGTSGTTQYWKGSYVPNFGTFTIYDGIATDEIYLVRAECLARSGKKDEAMADLNALLRKRWNGTFADLTAIDTTDALYQIFTERRKELVFRGLRWSDLRRFNLEKQNITLARKINGTTYTLPPNDLRWVLLIPNLETSRSDIPQNPR